MQGFSHAFMQGFSHAFMQGFSQGPAQDLSQAFLHSPFIMGQAAASVFMASS